ncbi:MAG TPA: 1-acyl-sn-glycerol-3-phosphate acyltransferase [Solirubrobacteraceae bacterium]|nr:1-acyl-sn-glycerol-3-phosphate acyltransferase [Solirubrobacteraceae bacterium]
MRPPAARRRIAFALGLTLELVLLGWAPVLLGLAAVAQAVGRPKPMIAVRSVLVYCAHELGVLAAGGALWALGPVLGRPARQRLHWRLQHWFVHAAAARILELLDVEITEDCAAEAAALLAGPEPAIVLSRHAGPGDTVFLIDRLMEHYRRRPSVVLRQDVALDPAIGLLTRRLPHGVIDPSEPDESSALIERLAADLSPHGVLLIYPEGGNFTRERRRRALNSLRRRGRRKAVAVARRMSNVLPPQPAGVLAALRGNPRAPVVFIAHTGLGLAAYPREIYRELPLGGRMRFRTWMVSREEVPEDEEARVAWLNGWWLEIDRWVRAQHAEPVILDSEPRSSGAPPA